MRCTVHCPPNGSVAVLAVPVTVAASVALFIVTHAVIVAVAAVAFLAGCGGFLAWTRRIVRLAGEAHAYRVVQPPVLELRVAARAIGAVPEQLDAPRARGVLGPAEGFRVVPGAVVHEDGDGLVVYGPVGSGDRAGGVRALQRRLRHDVTVPPASGRMPR